MKQPRSHRAVEGTVARSGRLSLNPYCIEDVGLTQADVARARAGAVTMVITHH